ncbi:MAG: hypothetical protein AAF990_19105, partial [Bacteroidota bacterium]
VQPDETRTIIKINGTAYKWRRREQSDIDMLNSSQALPPVDHRLEILLSLMADVIIESYTKKHVESLPVHSHQRERPIELQSGRPE